MVPLRSRGIGYASQCSCHLLSSVRREEHVDGHEKSPGAGAGEDPALMPKIRTAFIFEDPPTKQSAKSSTQPMVFLSDLDFFSCRSLACTFALVNSGCPRDVKRGRMESWGAMQAHMPEIALLTDHGAPFRTEALFPGAAFPTDHKRSFTFLTCLREPFYSSAHGAPPLRHDISTLCYSQA